MENMETSHLNNKTIRKIKLEDNQAIAIIIRSCLKEFGADKPGTVYYDESTDHLFELFSEKKSIYFIAEIEGKIVGGGGVFPSDGLPEGTCELVKMYLLPEARKTGTGAALMNKCLETAKELGFKNIYLESMPELKRAISVYEKFNFTYLNEPLGNTGHHGCSVWMTRPL
jgi:putative acetyltransferase